jgi:hypothetical protein
VINELLGRNDVVGGKHGGENVLVLLDLLPLISDRRGFHEGTLHGSLVFGFFSLDVVLKFWCKPSTLIIFERIFDISNTMEFGSATF